MTVKETDLDGDGDRDQLLLFARPDINGIPSRWEAGAVLDDDLRSTNRVDVAPRYPDACYPTFCYPMISGVVDADGKPGAEAFVNTGPAGAAYVGFVILSVNRDDLVLVEPGTDESETLGDLRVGGSNIHGTGFECRPSTGELRVYSIYMSEKATWTWDSITYIWTNDKSLIVADARSGVIRARGPNDQRVFRYYSSSCGALVFDS